jgi:hypothetical protein
MRSAPEKVFRWVAGIVVALKRTTERSSPKALPPSDTVVQSGDSRALAAEREDVATESHAAALTGAVLETPSVAVDATIDQVVQLDHGAVPPDDQEIQRRRDLVRALFNDFWSESENKPASFAARLDQAEGYLNERLTACGEFWRLDAKTRQLLGLPPSSHSPDGANGAFRR